MALSVDDRRGVETIYRRWAPFYDTVFGSVFERGRRAVAAATGHIGGRVLEVGVGTGISLPYYPDHCRIIGVDISSEMLEKARRRVDELGLRHVERLAVMDAERLEFPDESFDAVAAVCVVNTVPHPEAAMEEFARVLRPGGEIILLSRVGADGGVRRAVEKILQPVASRLGWRSEFPWERFSGWISSSQHEMEACERSPMPPFGHFSLLRFRKLPASAA
jgi:phosphatidylethanolamine/phosphatidyl-N-methylethanolamine N-methyltransferase